MIFIEALCIGMGYSIMDHFLNILAIMIPSIIGLIGAYLAYLKIKDDRLEKTNELKAELHDVHSTITNIAAKCAHNGVLIHSGSCIIQMENEVNRYLNKAINSGRIPKEDIENHRIAFNERITAYRNGYGELVSSWIEDE